MTGNRADIPRLAASLAVLGTELEAKGQVVFDTLGGWKPGIAGDPMAWTRGGGGTESDAQDRKDEARQARRAGEHHAEFVADLRALDGLVQSLNRRLDMACPPDVSQLRNRRTGEFDPETATDMLTAGWCPQCWLNGLGSVPLAPTEGPSSVRRYSDRCRPCGDFRKANNVDMPKPIATARAEGRRLTVQETDKLIAAAKAAANPKKNKRKKGKKAA